jgi:hypothetical protein
MRIDTGGHERDNSDAIATDRFDQITDDRRRADDVDTTA